MGSGSGVLVGTLQAARARALCTRRKKKKQEDAKGDKEEGGRAVWVVVVVVEGGTAQTGKSAERAGAE
jgi:hypothetical protein